MNVQASVREDNVASIRKLNDELRRSFSGGTVFMTPGVQQSFKPNELDEIATLVKTYNDFSPEIDPTGFHEMGRIIYGGEKIYFKIDYYDQQLKWGSPDPASKELTHRVMTILLPIEY